MVDRSRSCTAHVRSRIEVDNITVERVDRQGANVRIRVFQRRPLRVRVGVGVYHYL